MSDFHRGGERGVQSKSRTHTIRKKKKLTNKCWDFEKKDIKVKWRRKKNIISICDKI